MRDTRSLGLTNVVQPILDSWSAQKAKSLSLYTAGSNGPAEADELLKRDGRAWRALSNGKAQ